MYQLTCPACKTPHKTPFVRLGAVAFCSSCNHRFPVKVEYFIRLAPENPIAPELVDRLLGIVPIPSVQAGPGTTSGAIPPQQNRAAAQQPSVNPPGQAAKPQAAPAAPAASTNGAAGAAAASTAPKPTTPTATQPQTTSPAPAAAAPGTAAPQQAAAQPATESKVEEPASTGFFGKLFKRFK